MLGTRFSASAQTALLAFEQPVMYTVSLYLAAHSPRTCSSDDSSVTCAHISQVIGEVTELSVDNIDQHPYHHHVQPYQIVALDNDTDAMNAWWRVRSTSFLSELGCDRKHTQKLLLSDLTAFHCMPVMRR